MRSWKCLLIAAFILGMLCGCSSKNATNETTRATTTTEATVPQSPSGPVQTIDYEAVLRNDAFPATDPLSQQLNAAVAFGGITASMDTLYFTLSAPNIAQDLIAWYEAQPSLTEEALEKQIITLLSGEKKQNGFALHYSIDEDGVVHIRYTDEYLAAVGCGIREFYTYLQNQILKGE